MQKAVLSHERRSADTYPDCGGNTLLARPQFAARRAEPRTGAIPRRTRAWMHQIAGMFARAKSDEARPLATQGVSQLSKGWAKRMHLVNGGRITCRSGKVWITLDQGGEDIVLTACESKSFAPDARVLVEALVASRISLEAL